MAGFTNELDRSTPGQEFNLVMGEQENPLTLQSVVARSPPAIWLGEMRSPFTLTFKGAPGQFFPQRIYSFRNDALGEHDIFIVPIGRECDSYLYEAVFN